jgi:hypothetical protein
MIYLACILLAFLAPAWAIQPLVIADFSNGVDEKGVPLGWELTEKTGKADFSIINDYGIDALHLRSRDTSYAFQKKLNVDTQQYPILTWKWKVKKLPEGGDFRKSSTDDQAAQLYIAFSNRKVIAYIWDTCAPQGLMEDACALPFIKIKAIVIRSGPEEIGTWITETRNVYEDYLKLFGKEPPQVAGIRIQINSQHTETSGESFFADVRFQKGTEVVDKGGMGNIRRQKLASQAGATRTHIQ